MRYNDIWYIIWKEEALKSMGKSFSEKDNFSEEKSNRALILSN